MDARSYSCSMVNPALPNDPPKSFTFDGVYAEDSTTEQIYNDIGFALVEVILSMIISKDRREWLFRGSWRATTGQYLPMDRLVVAKASLCKESMTQPHRGESFHALLSTYLRSGYKR